MFFSWKWLQEKYPEYKDLRLQVVVAPRNVGKSYATYQHILDQGGFTPTSKVLFIRNTDKEVKTMINDFKSRFNQFVVKGSMIYEKKNEVMVNKKTGTEVPVEKAGELVGYFADISNYHNFKSMEAKDVKHIFYEEFNEAKQSVDHLYFKFINLIKTFSRFNNPFIYLLGNKDGFRNDFFVNWDIRLNDDPETNLVQEITSATGRVIGVWYDLCIGNFKALKNDETTADLLASLDKETARYAAGGFKDPTTDIVLSYKRILPDLVVSHRFGISGYDVLFGKIKDTDSYGLVRIENCDGTEFEHYNERKLIVLDSDSVYLQPNPTIPDTTTTIDFMKRLFFLITSRRLLFDSYELYDAINDNNIIRDLGILELSENELEKKSKK